MCKSKRVQVHLSKERLYRVVPLHHMKNMQKYGKYEVSPLQILYMHLADELEDN